MNEFNNLVAAALDGTATSEQHEELAKRLRSDAALRAEYVTQMRLDACLRFAKGSAVKGKPVAARNIPRLPVKRVLAAAAAVVLAGLTALWSVNRGVEVEIVQSSGTWQAGQRVRLGHLKMDIGHVQMRLTSGVLLDVAAPVEMQFVDAMHVRVTFGQVTADVGDDGKGFIVDTAQAQVVDLGTKFGVDVTRSGHTDVVVFQGEVEVFDRQPKRGPMTRLVEGEAVRVDARQQLSRIMSVTSIGSAAAWSTRGDDKVSVIASVHDNLRDPGAKNYYRIISGGLREDARAFVGQRHEWNGLTAAGMPAELLDADLVQTFVNDRAKVALDITITVSRPAVLYVLFDSRTAAPTWLEETFTDTGARIGLENAPKLDSGHAVAVGPGAGNMAPFAVWKRELQQAGSITLGSPRDTPDQRMLWMYGIAAKPL
ncbi:MAG: FecR domain-containing protein [Verrucomicrobiaceae bacterium]|nr:FecR domain-containing protein [Verrucomicrobiaceae bacterium]